jgi:hypothetical protein
MPMPLVTTVTNSAMLSEITDRKHSLEDSYKKLKCLKKRFCQNEAVGREASFVQRQLPTQPLSHSCTPTIIVNMSGSPKDLSPISQNEAS